LFCCIRLGGPLLACFVVTWRPDCFLTEYARALLLTAATVIPLPVDSLIPQLIEHLKQSDSAIIEAPPGSGKTTRVAPALIDAGLCDSRRRTFLLQPRRVAAKATAQRIASERGSQLGAETGYQVRFDSKVSAATSLIVATEGVLLRRLATDPAIEDVGAVVLDEFHERSLNADLLLGMLRQIQQLVRNDLQIIVMSATLDAAPLEKFLQCKTLRTEGTLYPVDIKYRAPRPREKMTVHAADTIVRTAERVDGDMLVFLPGVGEISQVSNLLQREASLRGCDIVPLHGSQPLEQQSRAIHAGQRRRIILSTNVAETSLTIEGIRAVIDSGQVRVMRFNAGAGLNHLQLEPVCKSSATQRAGRAGRLQSGVCIRLWDERSHRARPEHLEPEIQRVDLSGAVLQLYHWGERPADFPWFETPRADSIAAAVKLLEQLGAVHNNRITPQGSRMAQLPVSPRLARMLLEAEGGAFAGSIATVAAMISERDPFLRERGSSSHGSSSRGKPPTRQSLRWDCDVTERLLALQKYYDSGESRTPFGEIHRGAAHTIAKVAASFIDMIQAQQPSDDASPQLGQAVGQAVAKALLLAFPDRLARRRKPGDSKARMAGGRGVRLAPGSGVYQPELFLCIDVDDASPEANVRQACGIQPQWLPEELIDKREEQFFNPSRKQVEARQRTYWADLMLTETTAPVTDGQQCRELLFAEASKQLRTILPDDKSPFQSWLTRMACLHDWAPELNLPKCDDALLLEILSELCPHRRSFAELQAAPWLDWLKSRLTPEQQQAVEQQCPAKIEVPSGSHINIDYTPGKPPVLAVRIQEVFSWTGTPTIGFGRVPVLLHLLAPNFRPQQVTDDLSSFWANTYPLVRKELRRRYPKHHWPEDPLTAKPECKGGRRKNN